MKIHFLAKQVFDDKAGRIVAGQVLEMPANKAQFYIQRGDAEPYNTKVLRDRPLMAAGRPLSALPVDQVLQEQTLNLSENGEKKKRTRKTKAL